MLRSPDAFAKGLYLQLWVGWACLSYMVDRSLIQLKASGSMLGTVASRLRCGSWDLLWMQVLVSLDHIWWQLRNKLDSYLEVAEDEIQAGIGIEVGFKMAGEWGGLRACQTHGATKQGTSFSLFLPLFLTRPSAVAFTCSICNQDCSPNSRTSTPKLTS